MKSLLLNTSIEKESLKKLIFSNNAVWFLRVLDDFKDYFKILGVSRNATDKEIKSAFRKLARKFHPDLHPHDVRAESEFQEINEAYEILSDEYKKSLMNNF